MNQGAHVVEAKLDASGLKTAIVASRFNHFIVEKLVDEWLAAHPEHPPLPHLEDGETMPVETPDSTVVAGPVSDWAAIFLTGLNPSEV